MKLSATSALVLLWARQECYASVHSRAYLDQLDLSEGESLYGQCKEIWPYYHEVIKNRKFGVFSLISEYLEKAEQPQLIMAGAGFDAMGIEVVDHFPHVNVFALDRENMSIKAGLVKQVLGDQHSCIKHIEADLSDSLNFRAKLCDEGWNSDLPSLMLFEGVS